MQEWQSEARGVKHDGRMQALMGQWRKMTTCIYPSRMEKNWERLIDGFSQDFHALLGFRWPHSHLRKFHHLDQHQINLQMSTASITQVMPIPTPWLNLQVHVEPFRYIKQAMNWEHERWWKVPIFTLLIPSWFQGTNLQAWSERTQVTLFPNSSKKQQTGWWAILQNLRLNQMNAPFSYPS